MKVKKTKTMFISCDQITKRVRLKSTIKSLNKCIDILQYKDKRGQTTDKEIERHAHIAREKLSKILKIFITNI